MNNMQFERLASLAVRHLLPKCKENSARAIDFYVSSDGEEFIFRVYTPCNYRQIWVKSPKQYYDTKMANPWWKERSMNGWIMTANHDSCWDEGFNLRRITDKHHRDINLLFVCYGDLPQISNGYLVPVVDMKNGGHLLSLLNPKTINLEGYDYLSVCHRIARAAWESGDELIMDFTGEHPKRKFVKILDGDQIIKIKYGPVQTVGKAVPFTVYDMKKLLGDGEWELLSLNHSREGVIFA